MTRPENLSEYHAEILLEVCSTLTLNIQLFLWWCGQVCHLDTISALASRLTVNTARLTMLRMRIGAETSALGFT